MKYTKIMDNVKIIYEAETAEEIKKLHDLMNKEEPKKEELQKMCVTAGVVNKNGDILRIIHHMNDSLSKAYMNQGLKQYGRL